MQQTTRDTNSADAEHHSGAHGREVKRVPFGGRIRYSSSRLVKMGGVISHEWFPSPGGAGNGNNDKSRHALRRAEFTLYNFVTELFAVFMKEDMFYLELPILNSLKAFCNPIAEAEISARVKCIQNTSMF